MAIPISYGPAERGRPGNTTFAPDDVKPPTRAILSPIVRIRRGTSAVDPASGRPSPEKGAFRRSPILSMADRLSCLDSARKSRANTDPGDRRDFSTRPVYFNRIAFGPRRPKLGPSSPRIPRMRRLPDISVARPLNRAPPPIMRLETDSGDQWCLSWPREDPTRLTVDPGRPILTPFASLRFDFADFCAFPTRPLPDRSRPRAEGARGKRTPRSPGFLEITCRSAALGRRIGPPDNG